MEAYATNLMKQLLDMRTDTQKFENCASAVKNGGYTDYVVTDKAAAMAALDSIKRKAQTIRSGMTEQANPIRDYNSSLMNELDFLMNNADTVMDRVKNGRVVVGSSNPDTSVVDQTAVMFGADNTMLDCERMVRMLRQTWIDFFNANQDHKKLEDYLSFLSIQFSNSHPPISAQAQIAKSASFAMYLYIPQSQLPLQYRYACSTLCF